MKFTQPQTKVIRTKTTVRVLVDLQKRRVEVYDTYTLKKHDEVIKSLEDALWFVENLRGGYVVTFPNVDDRSLEAVAAEIRSAFAEDDQECQIDF